MRKYRLSEEQRTFSYQEDSDKKVFYYGRLLLSLILMT